MNDFTMAGKRWSYTEDANLANEIFNNLTVEEIATKHKRTSCAIKLRKLELAYKEYTKKLLNINFICIKYRIDNESLFDWIKKKEEPKIKTETELIPHIPKKRGRKPKVKTVSEPKIPKKRGRKPRINISIDDVNYLRQDVFEIKNNIFQIHKKLDEIININNAIYEFENK